MRSTKRTYPLLTLLITIVFYNNIYSQNSFIKDQSNEDIKNIANFISERGFIDFKKGFEVNNVSNIEVLERAVGLNKKERLKGIGTTEFNDGYVLKFQHFYNDIPIYGSLFNIIFNEGKAKVGKAKLINGLDNLNTSPSLSMEEAFNVALAEYNDYLFMWQIDTLESNLKLQMNDPNATYKPTGELFIFNSDMDDQWNPDMYNLHYRFVMKSVNPNDVFEIWVNAHNGSLTERSLLIGLKNKGKPKPKDDLKPEINHELVNGKYDFSQTVATGIPLYNNGQSETFVTNWTGFNYELKDQGTRNIETRKDDIFGWSNADKYLESGTNWTWSSNEKGWSSHWAAKISRDYFHTVHFRNGMDGSGGINRILAGGSEFNGAATNIFESPPIIYVGFYEAETPLHSLSTISHEWTHGVHDEIVGMISRTQDPGELEMTRIGVEEGIGDIFGIAVNRFNYGTINWDIGHVFPSGPGFEPLHRSLSSPNTTDLSDMVGDSFWNDATTGYERSGVMGHWFFLLSQGGTHPDTNVTVSSIGFDKAIKIIFRAFIYMQTGDVFEEVREATVRAANDLYGGCSNETNQVVNAWDAVNVNGVDCGFGQSPLSVSITGKNNLFVYQSGTYSANVSGGQQPYSYSWTVNTNNGNTYYNSSSFTKTMYSSDGYFDIDLTITDANSNTDHDSYYVYCNDCSGGGPGLYSLQASPNPVRGQLEVSLLNTKTGDYITTNFSIFDIYGENWFNSKRSLKGKQIIDVTQFPRGMYILSTDINGISLKKHLILK